MTGQKSGTADLVLARGLTALLFLLGAVQFTDGQHFDDVAAVMRFQRAADSYAFLHRQVQRRLGEPGEATIIADGMRRARPDAVAGDFFTPLVGTALRSRIKAAFAAPGCPWPPSDGVGRDLPKVNADAADARPISSCLAVALPNLPSELEYRQSGVALLLVDRHADLVVDVLPGAFLPTWSR